MGDRKFLIVPKHSILSVSPTIGAAVSTPVSKPVASPVADKAPVTIIGDQNASTVDMPVAAALVSASLGPCNDPSFTDPSPNQDPDLSTTTESVNMPEANSTASDAMSSGEIREELTQPAQTDTE